ncbi:lipid A biosynthesis acyltransferase [Rhizobium sp. CF080]|uniref:lysophospholipid acyltransferase family protein n=1 Tax=Rhizobium sp. (strain CF080) TaxID=1144310 RepID=UPI00027177CB|nr:Lauroyl/myristoyl acyltransferase [Rhizobium sp. CF080]EUB95016.1 lipid A biosynthesis acyltransferase [Rhizobium sp. CF080]
MEENRPLEAGHKASKRKAWVFEEGTSLRFSDFLAGGEARRQFFKHLRKETPRDIRDLLMVFAFKMLPASVVSNIGGFLGRHVIPRRYKVMSARARENFRIIRPEASETQIEAWLEEFADSQGRQRAEYAVMRRLAAKTQNIRFVGTENLVQQCAGQPVIFIGLHLANWEVAWQSLVAMGLELTGSYDPPKRRVHHWLVNRERRRDRLTVLKPGKDAVRPALQTLKDNGNLIVFCDEGFEGKVRAPLFGRPAHLQGNYAFVARLARKTDALLYPIYVTRDRGTHFTFRTVEPFRLPPEDSPGGRLIDDVKLINSVVEPIVAQHVAQWFFVAHRIVPL